jgi:hypothetical protein
VTKFYISVSTSAYEFQKHNVTTVNNLGNELYASVLFLTKKTSGVLTSDTDYRCQAGKERICSE